MQLLVVHVVRELRFVVSILQIKIHTTLHTTLHVMKCSMQFVVVVVRRPIILGQANYHQTLDHLRGCVVPIPTATPTTSRSAQAGSLINQVTTVTGTHPIPTGSLMHYTMCQPQSYKQYLINQQRPVYRQLYYFQYDRDFSIDSNRQASTLQLPQLDDVFLCGGIDGKEALQQNSKRNSSQLGFVERCKDE